MSVYFVQAGIGGRIKIGFSPSPQWRIPFLQRMSGPDLITLAIIEGNRGVEHALHVLLNAHRHHGEWFEPAREVLAIVERAKMLPQDPVGRQDELRDIDFTEVELAKMAAGTEPVAKYAFNYLDCGSRHYGDALAGLLRLGVFSRTD